MQADSATAVIHRTSPSVAAAEEAAPRGPAQSTAAAEMAPPLAATTEQAASPTFTESSLLFPLGPEQTQSQEQQAQGLDRDQSPPHPQAPSVEPLSPRTTPTKQDVVKVDDEQLPTITADFFNIEGVDHDSNDINHAVNASSNDKTLPDVNHLASTEQVITTGEFGEADQLASLGISDQLIPTEEPAQMVPSGESGDSGEPVHPSSAPDDLSPRQLVPGDRSDEHGQLSQLDQLDQLDQLMTTASDQTSGQLVPMTADEDLAMVDAMSMTDAPDILTSLEQPEPEEPDPMQAFAKLSFPDGDFYVHTYAVALGRDVDAHKHERRSGKHRKRLERRNLKEQVDQRRRMYETARIQDQARFQDVTMDEADGVSPRDTGSVALEDSYPGGTAMSVSNFSEVGGIMGLQEYSGSEEDNQYTSRRKKKRLTMMRSSNSSHSVDPNTLHANPQDLMQTWDQELATPVKTLPQGLENVAYQCPLIPIHPQAGASFKGISRKHIRIEYSLEKAYWEMLVTGRNTVFHNGDRVETGETVKLDHGSEIIIQTITIIFKLPDNARDDEEEEPQPTYDESDSPLSELGNDLSNLFSSDDDLPLVRQKKRQPERQKRTGIIKLKFSGKNKNKFAEKFSSSTASSTKDRLEKVERLETRDKHEKSSKDTHDKHDRHDKHEKPSKSGKQSSKINKSEKRPEKPEKVDKKEKQEKATKTIKIEKDKVDKAERLEKEKVKERPKEKPKEKTKDRSASISVPVPPPDTVPEDAIITTTQTTPVFAPAQLSSAAPETPVMPPPSLPPDVKMSVEDEALALALQSTPGPSETPPALPADLPAGSVLVGVAPEDIPQKRKGPGRPPKNGVMSKRDEAIIKRLTKDLQKQGKSVPSLNELLLMARAEGSTKKDKPDEKDGDVKMSLEGSTTPGPVIDPAIMQSIEGTGQGTPQAVSQATPDKDTKPKRVVRTPSPQKPESEYSEEELKKPTQTYVVLIHEALSKSSTGIMDLQQIYDAMQKMYPFFKYRAGTSGWQSSVRHNLISSEAFQEAGKIGKGRLWKINPDVSIDKEKKRKAPTPPPQSAPQYPYYPNGQYPYGPPQHGAPGYSPYPRPSPYGTPYGPPAAQPGARPPVPAAQQKAGTYYSPYASNPVAHASPYGPPSRPPYAAYPPPTQGQPPQAPPAQSPYGPPVPQGQPSQPNSQPGPPGQQSQQGQQVPSTVQPSYPSPAPLQGQDQPQSQGQPPQQHVQPLHQSGPPPPQNGPPPQQNGPPPQQNGQAQLPGPYQGQPNGQYIPPTNQPPQQRQHSQSQPPTAQPQPLQEPKGQPHLPTQHTQQQSGQQPNPSPAQSQPPPPQPPSTQQASTTGGIDIPKALAAIMAYQQSYVEGLAPGKELDEKRALFTKAMKRAISSQSLDVVYDSPAEEKLTREIAQIYAQSRMDMPPANVQESSLPSVQQHHQSSQPPPQQQIAQQYSSARPTPSPAPSMHNVQPHQPPPQTPAPPQGNIPSKFLPPQYNPQAVSSAPAPPSQQNQQWQRQGSTSEAHLAQALRASIGPPSAPGTPVPQPNPQPRGPYSQPQQQYQPSPYASRPTSQAGLNQLPPSQQQPGHASVGYSPSPSVHGNVGQQQHSQVSTPAPQAPMHAAPSPANASTGTPGPAPPAQMTSQQSQGSMITPTPHVQHQGQAAVQPAQASQAPPRPTFTSGPPGSGSGQQASKMPVPPRPTFAPGPAVGAGNGNASATSTVTSQAPAQVQAPMHTTASGSVAEGISGSLKRPIEIDEEDGSTGMEGTEAKRVRLTDTQTAPDAKMNDASGNGENA